MAEIIPMTPVLLSRARKPVEYDNVKPWAKRACKSCLSTYWHVLFSLDGKHCCLQCAGCGDIHGGSGGNSGGDAA